MDSEAKRTWIQTPVLPLASGIFSLGSQEPRPGTRAWRNIWIVHRAFRVGLLGDTVPRCALWRLPAPGSHHTFLRREVILVSSPEPCGDFELRLNLGENFRGAAKA